MLLLISSQLQHWKSFTSFRSERLFLFSVQCCKIKTKAISTANRCKGSIMRNQWELEVKIRNLPEVWETRVTKLWLVLVLNLIGRESGANFLDRSKREVKQEQIIFGESYTFKTICSWWWSTTINFYNGFLLFLPFSWSMSTPHSSKWRGSRHRKRWRRWMWQPTKRWLVSFPKQARNTNADYVSTDWFKMWYSMARLVRRSSSDGGGRNSNEGCLLSKTY